MHFFNKTSIGMEITQVGISCAQMSGSSKIPLLSNVVHCPLPADMLRISHRDHHVQSPELFVENIRTTWRALDSKESRVAVSLPDASGRIMLLDLEDRWKNKQEAADMIRWKLKKSLPLELSDIHLDFQVLERGENGETAVMAGIISKRVVGQYEELFDKAGLQPDRINFNTLHLHGLFHHVMHTEPHSAFFSLYDRNLSILFFSDELPVFYRAKSLPGISVADNRLYMEVNSSLVAYRQRWPERIIGRVYCLAPPDMVSDFCSMTSEVTGLTCIPLELGKVVRPSDKAPADHAQLFQYAAAIGAAVGRLQ